MSEQNTQSSNTNQLLGFFMESLPEDYYTELAQLFEDMGKPAFDTNEEMVTEMLYDALDYADEHPDRFDDRTLQFIKLILNQDE